MSRHQGRAAHDSPFADGSPTSAAPAALTDWAQWDDWAEPGETCGTAHRTPTPDPASAPASADADADADRANATPGAAHPGADADRTSASSGPSADRSGATYADADRTRATGARAARSADRANATPGAGADRAGASPGSGAGRTSAHADAADDRALGDCADAVALVGVAGHGGDVSWGEAWRVAWGAGRAGAGVARGLGEALGCALAEPLVALTDLPAFDSSAMDGWAVAGPGPWRLTGQVLAGGSPGAALADGEAVRIATGAPLPEGATAVLRRECGATREAVLYATGGAPGPGQDVRPRGQECRSGDALVAAGRVVTPAVLGLAAAAGYDRLAVVPRPRVELLVLGDELLEHGVPGDGRVRDALGPMLPGWLRTLGADLTAVRRLVDDAEALRAALTATDADVVLTTGGTAAGPADHVHPVLARLGAELLIDGVAVRPGHPMLLARLPGGAHLVGLPGNPLAAVCGVLTLAAPLIGAVAGRAAPVPYRAPLTEAVTGHRAATRLVPVAYDDESRAVPLPFTGPAMLRGLAIADGLAVIPPGGLPRGAEATVLDTCWTPTAGPPAAA